MDDDELVKRLIAGDPTAQLHFIEQYYEKLSEQFIRKFENVDEGAIQDAINDILYEVIENPRQIKKSKGSVGAFVYKVAQNRVIDQYRNKKNRRLTRLDGNGTEGEVGVEPKVLQVTDQYPSLADDTITSNSYYPSEVIQVARELLNNLQLSTEEQEHLRLRRIDRLQPVEIAPLLGITPENERVRWLRLKRKLDAEEAKYPILVEFKAQFTQQDAISHIMDKS